MNEQNKTRGISIVEIVIGFAAAGALFVFTPVLEMLEMFMWVVVLPLALFASVGLISDGSIRFMGQGLKDFVESLKSARDKYSEPMAVTATTTTTPTETAPKQRRKRTPKAEKTENPATEEPKTKTRTISKRPAEAQQ